MKKTLNFLLLSIVFLSMGCASAKLTRNSPLFHHKWVLSELNNAPVQISNTDRDAFLEFSYNDRKVTGYGGCNSITGTFNAEGSAFSFSPLATTKMSREDTKFEDAFLTALSKVNKYEIDNGQLILKHDKKVLTKMIGK